MIFFSSCGSLLAWLIGVLVNGAESVSEGSSPLPLLSVSTPPTHSQLIALISAVMGAATKIVSLTMGESENFCTLSSIKFIIGYSTVL